MLSVGDRVSIGGKREGTVIKAEADEVLVELDPFYYHSEVDNRDREYPGHLQFRYYHWQVTKR